ncbi:hypothetical protein D9M72_503820 [compost metagenome]
MTSPGLMVAASWNCSLPSGPLTTFDWARTTVTAWVAASARGASSEAVGCANATVAAPAASRTRPARISGWTAPARPRDDDKNKSHVDAVIQTPINNI